MKSTSFASFGVALLLLATFATLRAAPAMQQEAQPSATAEGQLLPTPTLAASPTDESASTPEAPDASEPVPTPALEVTQPLTWSAPVNLSHSGSTSDPQMVVDSDGTYHALWRDAFDGYVYSSGDGASWSAPAVVDVPFATRRFLPEEAAAAETPYFAPRLVADTQGNIHAFWIDDSATSGTVLYHSQVASGQFTSFDAWSPRSALASGAVGKPAAIEVAGQLHAAFVRSGEGGGRPAGVYYANLNLGGSWSEPVALATSRYMRGIAPQQANVQIASSGQEIYVAWDDAGREQVFVARSPNGGGSWEAPQEIDRRLTEDAPEATGPRNIQIGIGPTGPVVIWQAGHATGETCTQYYRSSEDGGQNWSLPKRLSQALPGCLTSAQLLAGDPLLMLGAIQTGTGADSEQAAYLLAWDGARWSEPQFDAVLSTFANADTNQIVSLQCLYGARRATVVGVIGCDVRAGKDSWYTARALDDIAGWFSTASAWGDLERIATSQAALSGLHLVADAAGSTHVFWHENGGSEIYHTRWDGQSWSPAVKVLSATNGAVSDMSVFAGDGRISLVWHDRAGLHFAQAGVDRPTEWSSPLSLTDETSPAEAPDIIVAGGELLIAYSVRLNESRGVYLLRSADMGVTWTGPTRIFDGAAAGWEMVDRPVLARTADGLLHAQFMHRSLPPEGAPLDLGYARSSNNGLTWELVEGEAAAPAVWSDLLGVGNHVVHRLWAEQTGERLALWHMVSPDSGATWNERQQIGSLPAGRLPAAVADAAGQPQVVGMEGSRLQNWFWNGEGWRPAETLTTALTQANLLDVSVDAAGRLVVVAAGAMPGIANQGGEALFGMARSLELPEGAPPTPPPPAATVQPTSTPAPTGTPEPTPTFVLPVGPADTGLLSQVPGGSSQAGQLGLAIIPAALVILIVAVLVRAARMGRKP